MDKFLEYLKRIWSVVLAIFSFLKRKNPDAPEFKIETPSIPTLQETPSSEHTLLSPKKHKRYVTMYYLPDLDSGSVQIFDRNGNEIEKISSKSLDRLNMEGTGRLPSGKVVNVDRLMKSGEWSFKVMDSGTPYGIGIKGKALEPWVSLATNLSQINKYRLLGRKVVIPELKGFEYTHEGKMFKHSGEFEIHDTGGAMKPCPYDKGLFRTGSSKKYYGQLDIFVCYPDTYKALLKDWDSYFDVIVMPRDLSSNKGIQETINLLIDAGLDVDGEIGPKTKAAILKLKESFGIQDPTDEWDDLVVDLSEKSLNRW